jgi:hypothetical protein
MSTLVWSDSSISECPGCGATVVVGIMSLCATCACGMYYVDADGWRGWYYSPAHFAGGGEPVGRP